MKIAAKKRTKVFIIIVSILLIVICGFFIYTSDYYKADALAVQVVASTDSKINQHDNITVFYPNDKLESKVGLIFYPGGKVEDIAYAPLLKKLSQNGITCVLVKMPFHLAVFDVSAADRVYSIFPHIESWYIGGHSLGGAMASSYVEKNQDKIKGLLLLGAYPIHKKAISVLAIYGSNDKVLDKSKLSSIQNKIEIAGGNHAYFGNYGEQKGDGTATITREEQQTQTVEAILKFLMLNSL